MSTKKGVKVMRLAVIADIHANIFALEKVFSDIAQQRVEQVICLGDLVGYGVFPNQVIDFIRQRDILTIQGNYDQSVAEDLLACGCDYSDHQQLAQAGQSLFWTQETVSQENKEWLKSLPSEKKLLIAGKTIYLVHGSPRRNNEYLEEDSPVINEILSDYEFDLLLCGHTHKPYCKIINDRCIVNAGSAGKPKHGNPRATYVILEIKETEISFVSREVEYDHEKIALAIEREPEMPSEFADLFRKGVG